MSLSDKIRAYVQQIKIYVPPQPATNATITCEGRTVGQLFYARTPYIVTPSGKKQMLDDQKCLLANAMRKFSGNAANGNMMPVTVKAVQDSDGYPWNATIQYGDNPSEKIYTNGRGEKFPIILEKTGTYLTE